MRFEVPQFIDVEDKLFGPFTFRQFIYLAGGAGLVYTLFRLLPLVAAIPLAVPIGGFALALVFYRPNNRPFIKMVESAFNYIIKQRFYLWRHVQQEKKTVAPVTNVPASESPDEKNKLKDLAWSLDILDESRTQ